MVLGWLTKETKSAYIARPDEKALDLIYLHPDKSIPRGAKLTVRSNECAVFFREGRCVGRIDAGTVLLDTANVPFLGHLLIDRFTNANHFICEVFFVLLSEKIFHVPMASLGQYRDMNSGHVVTIHGSMSYTVKVSEPEPLIRELGGQHGESGAVVKEIFDGRMLNQLRKLVATRVRSVPVLDVVSNIDGEAMSEEIRDLGRAEFQPLGIGVGRFFDFSLQLDAESQGLLRDFGRQEANLEIQSKGMRLAGDERFSEFNRVQGQRAVQEGLANGLSTGNMPALMTGNLGAVGGGYTGTSSVARAGGAHRPATILSREAMFILMSDTGETGPYTARLIALLALSRGVGLAELKIRGADDAQQMVFAAELEPQIVAEYTRRRPTASANKSAGNPVALLFNLAVTDAAKDGRLAALEVRRLAELAVSLGLDTDAVAGRARVFAAAQANNIGIEE